MAGNSSRPEHPTRHGSDVTVVTVDDQQVFREVAQEVIEATAGFKCVGEACSGAEGLGLVDERRPQLVLVDVRMPGMGGMEVARRIKDAHPEVVVVLISIEEPANFSASLAASGAEALVRKQDFGPHMLRGLWQVHGARA